MAKIRERRSVSFDEKFTQPCTQTTRVCALCATHRRQVASAVVGPQQHGQLQEMRQCCLDGAVGTAVCACELGEGCALLCTRHSACQARAARLEESCMHKYAVPNHIPFGLCLWADFA